MSKWVNFIDISHKYPQRKTKTWQILSNMGAENLGVIGWYSPWRQYCFFAEHDTVWNAECMNDVTRFIRQQMEARKK